MFQPTPILQIPVTWIPNTTYYIQELLDQPGVYYLSPAVIYNNLIYYMNGSASQSNPSLNPNTDPSFSAFTGSSNILQQWFAATNTPTLTNGTNTGFSYINLSPGTNNVNFGAGNIAFDYNDTVLYDIDDNIWYNGGQASGIQSVTSSTPNLLSATLVNGNVALSIVNSNQTAIPGSIFDYTQTDLYLVGNVSLDVSQMILNRLYGVTAIGGNIIITPINGNFINGGNLSIVQTNSVTLKKVSVTQVNIY